MLSNTYNTNNISYYYPLLPTKKNLNENFVFKNIFNTCRVLKGTNDIILLQKFTTPTIATNVYKSTPSTNMYNLYSNLSITIDKINLLILNESKTSIFHTTNYHNFLNEYALERQNFIFTDSILESLKLTTNVFTELQHNSYLFKLYGRKPKLSNIYNLEFKVNTQIDNQSVFLLLPLKIIFAFGNYNTRLLNILLTSNSFNEQLINRTANIVEFTNFKHLRLQREF